MVPHPARIGVLAGVRAPAALAAAVCVWACAPGAGPAAITPASEAEWRALATPRQVPVTGAARVSLGNVEILGEPARAETTSALTPLGLSELVAAGLLRRADVQFVERRRFSAAVEAERAGTRRPAGAPAAGVSAGAEYLLRAVWITTPGVPASVELRLDDTETGAVAHAWRAAVSEDVDPVGLARGIVGELISELSRLDRVPAWEDPIPSSAPESLTRAGVSDLAVRHFLRGVSAEEAWDWESARLGYQAAIAADPSFFEASAALARVARLRQGGTLGES